MKLINDIKYWRFIKLMLIYYGVGKTALISIISIRSTSIFWQIGKENQKYWLYWKALSFYIKLVERNWKKCLYLMNSKCEHYMYSFSYIFHALGCKVARYCEWFFKFAFWSLKLKIFLKNGIIRVINWISQNLNPVKTQLNNTHLMWNINLSLKCIH